MFDLSYKPPVGFHFAVVIELFPQSPQDLRFKEVQGLTVDMGTENIAELGENRFEHQLPTKAKYSDLILKRGLLGGSGLIDWVKDSIEGFNFKPVNITITLLNNNHLPVGGWYVVNAYPIQWTVSNFDAQTNSVAIESLKLKYSYFTMLNIPNIPLPNLF